MAAAVLSWISTLVFTTLLSTQEAPILSGPSSLFLVSPAGPSIADIIIPSCATNSYYGSYGRPLQHVYGISDSCHDDANHLNSQTGPPGIFTLLLRENGQKPTLLWLQDAGVDESLRGGSSFDDDMEVLLGNVRAHLASTRPHDHVPMRGPSGVFGGSWPPMVEHHPDLEPEFAFLHRTPTGAIIAVNEGIASDIDTLLPPYVAAIALPDEPSPFVPVSKEATERVKGIVCFGFYHR